MSDKGYETGSAEYLYPHAGDRPAPKGDKVIVLTVGGVANLGPWWDDGSCLAWCPLPKRNKEKEKTLEIRGVLKA